MRGRTFFRIMIDNLFINNTLCKTISAFINFCNEQNVYKQNKLKFSEKMPLNNVEQTNNYSTKFIFNTKQTSGVNFK